MYKTTDEFYTANRPATLYVGAASFAVWILILALVAAI
ncbi:MAG: hypothetical protein ACI8S3_000887 [Alphaproteobacteria bacterium]|jgi:hypothetical protein